MMTGEGEREKTREKREKKDMEKKKKSNKIKLIKQIKSDGESFLIAFGDPINALNFCLTSQQLLLDAKWSDSLLNILEAREMRY